MNKALKILVEGKTELEFVKSLLVPHLNKFQIYNVHPITIETSPGFKGGDVRYNDRYKKHIKRLLLESNTYLVTSLIDYYRLDRDFPNFKESQVLPKERRVDFIEQGCFEDVNDDRFLPYIQVHEFEALLFASEKGFNNCFWNLPSSHKKELLSVVSEFENPELINERPGFAPSERLKKLIPEYDKPFFGNMIALENGLDIILKKCPRFSDWVNTLIQRMQKSK